jgi:phenylacetate-CoA ligase
VNRDGTPNDAISRYEERCRRVLTLALERTALYERWRPLDPGPSRPLDERFAALPVTTKDDIRAHFPRGLVPRGMDLDAALARGELSFVRTSGTADEALENLWNQAWWDGSERASWTLNAHAAAAADGAHPEAILASALSVGPRSDGPPIPLKDRMLGRFLFLNEHGRADAWPVGHEARILSELDSYRPTVLEANPSLLARVCRWAHAAGVRPRQPELITLTYEYPSELHLRAIRRVFGCPVASSYGSTETGYVFMECEHGRLHQNAATCRVDMLPLPGGPGGRVVPPGGLGRIVATTLGNDWFPLLRFEVGDVGRVAEGPCPCGRSFGVTLSAVEGRLKSLCRAADGSPVTHRRIDLAMASVDSVAQYRVDQPGPDEARCAVVAEPGAGRGVEAGVRDALAALFGAGVRVDVRSVPSLAPEASGKFLLVLRSFPLEEAFHG